MLQGGLANAVEKSADISSDVQDGVSVYDDALDMMDSDSTESE